MTMQRFCNFKKHTMFMLDSTQQNDLFYSYHLLQECMFMLYVLYHTGFPMITLINSTNISSESNRKIIFDQISKMDANLSSISCW